MRWKRIGRIAGWLAAGLLAVELLYVLVANAILFSGVIQGAASKHPDEIEMAWDRAYTFWPGRAHVSGFRLRLQDANVQFRLTVDSARVTVDLPALLHRKFRALHVNAEGVSYRMLGKVESVAGNELRLAAFPPLEGFARPALRPNPEPPPSTSAQLDSLWSVELDDVEATVSELWFLEYRYHGPAQVHGAFALVPMRKLWVGPALLHLDGGELSAGEHVISRAFTARAEVTIAPVDLPSSPGLLIFRSLTTSIRFVSALEDLGVADLYHDGLRARGAGRVAADVHVAGGRLTAGSSLEVFFTRADAQLQGYRFTGDAHGKLSVSEEAGGVPAAEATVSGALVVPVLDKGSVVADFSDLTAKLTLLDNDLSRGLSLQRLRAVLGEARVLDARAVTRAVGDVVPLVAPIVMGKGPLVMSATAFVTPEYTLVRIRHLQQGCAELEGAAVPGAKGWKGAMAGHFGAIPFGLRLQDSKFAAVPFPAEAWLDAELIKAGIQPEQPALGRADGP